MTDSLVYRLRGLATAGTLLQIGAHPDDEESALLAYASHGLGVRAVYWSATRGEGGQNRRGPEAGAALGLIRTWESLKAREVDGAEVAYGPFYDYGFSKRGDDALRRWGAHDLTRELVRAIRLVQPLVVVCRWRGDASDGHGHHQAVGAVAAAAFEAAADPAAHGDLGLPAWRAAKLYRSLAPDWQPGMDEPDDELDEGPGYLRLDAGEIDPIAGLSYWEQACLALNCHRSQGVGFVPEAGPRLHSYRLERSLTPGGLADVGFLDGCDATLGGLAAELREPLAAVCERADAALEAFRPQQPELAGHILLDGLDQLRELRRIGVDPALDAYLLRKEHAFEAAAAACLGLRLECAVDAVRTTAGRTVGVRCRLVARDPVESSAARLEVPKGWNVEAGPDGSFAVHVPRAAQLTTPHWLREPRGAFRYAWPETGQLGAAIDPPPIAACIDARVDGRDLTLRVPGLCRSAFPGGFRELGLSVLPPMSVQPRRLRDIAPAGEADSTLDVAATVRCIEEAGAEGVLSLRVPDGWSVRPAREHVRLGHAGATQTVEFEVLIPGHATAGAYDLRCELDVDGQPSAFNVEPIRLPSDEAITSADESNCAAEAFEISDAHITLSLVDAVFVKTLRYGYVEGQRENVLESLRHFDLDISALDDDDLAYSRLADYDAIVVGPNAYNVRGALQRNARRLLDYVAEGGTLIVQYQTYGFDRDDFAPYFFSYAQPHDRVTDPTAPVTMLDRQNALMHLPNELGEADFEGWTHDRGLYFFTTWDDAYRPMLASADEGEEALEGGLLIASHGCGSFVYCAYSLYRQIPAGVPGAIRLFANLLGIAEARVRERCALLRTVALFESFSDDDLYEAARAVSERRVREGEYIAREGDRGSELYILGSGAVEVVKGEGHGSRIIATVQQGEAIGELAVLTDLPRSAGLRAADGDATVLVLPASELRTWLHRHPELALRMMERLARMLMERG